MREGAGKLEVGLEMMDCMGVHIKTDETLAELGESDVRGRGFVTKE